MNEPRKDASTGVKILILDDEPCVSELLSEMLKLLGYAPTKCSSPVTALELIQKQEFDVILSDFRMPQMNGDEFFREATAGHPKLARRIVFLTGDSMNEETQDFLTGQGCRHLGKPFDLASVERVISEIAAQAGAVAA